MQGHRCAYRDDKQDPEELLDSQMLMSPDKCLKDLICDMSTGSGSGKKNAASWFHRYAVRVFDSFWVKLTTFK